MPAIRAAHPGAGFAVAGGGDDRARLEALAAELGLTDALVFLGRIGDGLKTAMQRSADLFMQPGRKVVEDGRCLSIDLHEASTRLQEAQQRSLARTPSLDWAGRSDEEMSPMVFDTLGRHGPAP